MDLVTGEVGLHAAPVAAGNTIMDAGGEETPGRWLSGVYPLNRSHGGAGNPRLVPSRAGSLFPVAISTPRPGDRSRFDLLLDVSAQQVGTPV
jgi:hypothetical protein